MYSQVPNKRGGGVKINGGWEFFEKFNKHSEYIFAVACDSLSDLKN